MRCTRCGNDYRASLAEENLISRGEIKQHCPRCMELAQYSITRAHAEELPKRVGWGPDERLPGRIIRVDRFNPEGRRDRYMLIPRTPLLNRGNPLVEPKRTVLKAGPMHVDHHGNPWSTAVSTRIITNLTAVLLTRRDLWFKKQPAFIDRDTGAVDINVPFRDIHKIDIDEGGPAPNTRQEPWDFFVNVQLKSGGRITVTNERDPRRRSQGNTRETWEDDASMIQ
jgi:phage FluMu protein Com